jgi:hypothetical protein
LRKYIDSGFRHVGAIAAKLAFTIRHNLS